MSPFAGRHPRWISAGSTSHEPLQGSRRIGPVTRVPGAPRGGHARPKRAARLCSSAPARDLPRPREWNATCESRRVRIAARRPPVRRRTAAANATGIGWCRRAAGRKPHSRARVERSSGVPARRIRLQKSASDAEAPRSALPRWQRGCVHESPACTDPKGSAQVKGVDDRCRGGQAARRPRPEPDAREGVAGRRSSTDGRYSGSSPPPYVHADGARTISAAPTGAMVARASSHTRERRQGYQRLGPHAPHREDNARSGGPIENVRPAEANRTAVKQAISPVAQARKRWTPREPTRRGCSYEDVRRQTSVRRIARRSARGAARRIDGATLAEELSAARADARSGGSEVTTVRAGARSHRPGGPRASPDGETRPVATRWKVSRSSLASLCKGRCGGGLGLAGASRRLWNRRGGARGGDEGHQRSVTCTVKAAPADEARAVRHTRRCEAPALEELQRGLRGRCSGKAAIGCAVDGSIEAGPCE